MRLKAKGSRQGITVKKILRNIALALCWLPTLLWANNDTVYVVGGIQHDGLIPTIDVGRPLQKRKKMKIKHKKDTEGVTAR